MKKIIFLLLLSVSLQVQAQGDFNYQFYPAPVYQKYFERYENDSSVVIQETDTSKIVGNSPRRKLVIDTTTTEVQVFIEKENGVLTITDIKFPTSPLYSEKVRFLGVLEDGFGSLLYESQGPEKEQVVINPTRGFAVVSFKKCFTGTPEGKIVPWAKDQKEPDKPEFCNFINHNFGTIDVKKYRPEGL